MDYSLFIYLLILSKDRVVQKDKPAIVLPTHIHTTQKRNMDKTKNNTKTINLKIHKKIHIKKENDGELDGIKLTF